MESLTHQFLAWCRSKPADEEYDYTKSRGCAFYQFLVAGKFPVQCVIPNGWFDQDGNEHPITPVIQVALRPLGGDYCDSFGALADRVERQIAEQVVL
jgi:hypothetical protein